MERKITIEENRIYQEDYQIRMLQMNHIEGLLKLKGRGVENHSFFDYDVSGKISMQAMFERSKMSSEELKIFLKRLQDVIVEVEKHLLPVHHLLLLPEYIFYEKEQFYFCYYPYAKQDFWKQFHCLTEYFVKEADYEDKECANMVMLLHKETLEENYSLDKIVSACMEGCEKEKYKKNREQWIWDSMEEEEDYDTYFHDKIAGKKQTDLLKEEDFWIPMKRFIDRRKKKKSKWGDWDHLYAND